nr:hypothetical protein [Kiritimatiellia bacterium]
TEPATPPPPAPAAAPPSAPPAKASYEVNVDGAVYQVDIDGDQVSVAGNPVQVGISKGNTNASTAKDPIKLKSQASGWVQSLCAEPGQKLEEGDAILILESLMMEMTVKAPGDCTLSDLRVHAGEKIKAGQVLAILLP